MLDGAFEPNSGADVPALLAKLRALDPGPLTHLEATYTEPADIIRFYPY